MQELFKKHFVLLITVLSVLFSIVFIFSNREKEIFEYWYEIMIFLNDVAIGLLAATIFYYFQVYLPEKRKREDSKRPMLSALDNFRMNCLSFIEDPWRRHGSTIDLSDLKMDWKSTGWEMMKFREFVDKKMIRIDLTHTVIKHYDIQDLQKAMIIFIQEIDFYTRYIDITTSEYVIFFIRFRARIFEYSLQNIREKVEYSADEDGYIRDEDEEFEDTAEKYMDLVYEILWWITIFWDWNWKEDKLKKFINTL
jgi:hypothetical protein